MDLYYHPLARQSQKTLIALYEKQANFYPHEIDLNNAFSRRNLQQLSRSQRLPLLQLQTGESFNDATIIIEYLDNYISSGTQLIPIEKTQALYVRLYDRLSDNVLDKAIDAWLASQAQSNQLKTKQFEKDLLSILADFDQRLADNHWVCGDSFTLADCAFIPCLKALEDKLHLLDYQNIGRYWIQSKLRGSVNQVIEEVELTLATAGQSEQLAQT
ncbi:glutathione S-transferase family protein [Shewanella pneumatophori]|uniref:Glutathione S-transferase family protein n=1 Tax=Shewanella pneumatophori TaxID=314092 RepID=A0A9X2CDS1_9GAMM|nr:glutathione S-transferase family protein [Shewanella pneumatophori]MCL1138227.1 glutathione S-transferase family protein [Shewanella pneumatophori]